MRMKCLYLMILFVGLAFVFSCNKSNYSEEERWIDATVEESEEKADSIISDNTEPNSKQSSDDDVSSPSYNSPSESGYSYDDEDNHEIDDEDLGIYDDETGEHYSYGGEYDEDNVYDYENFAEDEGDF